MKATFFTGFHRNQGDVPLTTVLEQIKNGEYAASVNELRQAKAGGDSERAEVIKKSLPAFTLCATYKGRRKPEGISRYNGVILLDIDKLPPHEVENLKAKAAAIPHTLFCFRSPGGEGLKIAVLPAVIHLPTAENHRQTFDIVSRYYEQQLGVEVDPSGKDVGRLCFVSSDEELFINEKWNIESGELKTGKLPLMEANSQPSTPDVQFLLRKARKQTSRRIKYAEGSRNNYVYLFANNCNRLGVGCDEVYGYGLKQFADMDADEMRAAVNSAFSHALEHGKGKAIDDIKALRCTKELADIENYLSERFTLRFNVVTRRVEYRKRKSATPFQPLDETMENTIWCDLQRKGIPCKQSTLRSLLVSDFSTPYDPFVAYFNSLPAWDGVTDYIGQLADTVQTTNQELWASSFRKWLVAMVACATLPDVENHTVLVINGAQGTGKTSWCCHLVPPELQAYRYSGIPNPESKDSMLTLSECILVNYDELGTLSMKEINKLKEMITKGVIRERRAYGRNSENYLRRASFTGSVNSHQVLSDLTGSRRFLCFEATTIDYKKPVDYKNVYAQAVALLKTDFRYWLNDADIEQINTNNEAFRVRTPEEEFFYTYFRKPTPEDTEVQWLSSSEILEVMCRKTNLTMSTPGTIRLGMMLRKDGFERLRKGSKYVFGTIVVPTEEVEDEKKRKPDLPDDSVESVDNQPTLLF